MIPNCTVVEKRLILLHTEMILTQTQILIQNCTETVENHYFDLGKSQIGKGTEKEGRQWGLALVET